jgi:hypothetical protein
LDQVEKADSFESAFLFALRNGASLLGSGSSGSGAGLALAAGIWAQDQEERDHSHNDAGDDDQQDRAAEGLSLLGWRGGGGGHVGLDAGCEVGEFLLRAERVFFPGFLRKHGAWMWFFGGVFVVECVVNVVKTHHQSRLLKIRHFLRIYFRYLILWLVDSAIPSFCG